MPLTPDDVQHLNKLLDKQLKFWRAWPRIRMLMLGGGAYMIFMGIWLWTTMPASLDEFPMPTPSTTNRVDASATQPVTHEQLYKILKSSEQLVQGYASFESKVESLRLSIIAGAGINVVLGIYMVSFALARWGYHRRETIIITLLREKCAAELAMPGSGGARNV